jgi:hypothetical protein
MVQDNSNSRLLFDTVSIAFIPGKILSEKTCRSYVRSIAELRVFDGSVESTDLKGLSTESVHTGYSNSYHPDQEFGALNKEVAGQLS